jgi:hypothetical protein
MTNASAGWYPDPDALAAAQPWEDPAALPDRYWDGTEWTDDVRPPQPGARARPDRLRTGTAFLIGVGIIAAPLIAVAAYFRLVH